MTEFEKSIKQNFEHYRIERKGPPAQKLLHGIKVTKEEFMTHYTKELDNPDHSPIHALLELIYTLTLEIATLKKQLKDGKTNS